MTRRASIARVALLAALLAGCSEKRIDSSTPESTATSLDEIQRALPDDKRKEFSEALAVVIPNALGGGYKDVGDTAAARERVKTALRDKTADDIIAEAARIRSEKSASKTKTP